MKEGSYNVEKFGKFELLISFLLGGLIILSATSKRATVLEQPEINFDNLILSAIVFAFLVGCLFGVLKGWKKLSPVELLGLNVKPESRELGIISVGWVLVTIVALGFRVILGGGEPPAPVTRSVTSSDVVYFFTAMVLIIPLTEEWLFRGYFYGAFKKHFGRVGGVIITAVLFALAHQDLASFPHYIGLSCLATWTLEKTGSLWGSFYVHALNNCIAFLIVLPSFEYDFVPK